MPNGQMLTAEVTRRGSVKQFYSVSEVAARFEVTSQTVRNWIAAGQLPSVQPTPGGRYRIDAQALLAFEQKGGLRPRDAAMGRGMGPPMNEMAGAPPGEQIPSELELVVRAIVKSVQPDAVILFGSRARGNFRADSDIDLAILAPDGVARRRVAKRAYESLGAVADRSVAVDIIVLTPSIISAERELPGSIARAVSREGVFLYGSPAAVA
jgi:excisionase family DNA binding protein